MMSAGPVPESAAALLIRGQINHNKLLSAFLVLAVIGNAAVIAAFAVGFTHQPAAALYLAGAVAVFMALGLWRSHSLAARLRAAGRDPDGRATRITGKVAEGYGIPRPAVVVLDWAGCNALTAGPGARAVMVPPAV